MPNPKTGQTAFVGRPTYGHTGFASNVPTDSGWVVTMHRTEQDAQAVVDLFNQGGQDA